MHILLLLRVVGNTIKSPIAPTLLDEFLFASLEFEVHNPDIPEELAYLTATLEGEPIRLNKTLVDADVVLPICTNLPNSIFGYAGFFHDLFPLYTETDTILRLRSKQNAEELKKKNDYLTNLYVDKNKGSFYESELLPLLEDYNDKYLGNIWRISHVGSKCSEKGDFHFRHKDTGHIILLDTKNNFC